MLAKCDMHAFIVAGNVFEMRTHIVHGIVYRAKFPVHSNAVINYAIAIRLLMNRAAYVSQKLFTKQTRFKMAFCHF